MAGTVAEDAEVGKESVLEREEKGVTGSTGERRPPRNADGSTI